MPAQPSAGHIDRIFPAGPLQNFDPVPSLPGSDPGDPGNVAVVLPQREQAQSHIQAAGMMLPPHLVAMAPGTTLNLGPAPSLPRGDFGGQWGGSTRDATRLAPI